MHFRDRDNRQFPVHAALFHPVVDLIGVPGSAPAATVTSFTAVPTVAPSCDECRCGSTACLAFTIMRSVRMLGRRTSVLTCTFYYDTLVTLRYVHHEPIYNRRLTFSSSVASMIEAGSNPRRQIVELPNNNFWINQARRHSTFFLTTWWSSR